MAYRRIRGCGDRVRRAVPAPENGRAHADNGRAFLDGNFVIVAHPHRQLGQHGRARRQRPADASRQRLAARGTTDARLRVLDGGRQQSSGPTAGRLRSSRAASKMAGSSVLAGAVFGRLAGEIDLYEQLQRRAAAPRPPHRSSARASRIVDRVNHVEAGRRLRRLVRLQVADEMPAQRKVRPSRAASAAPPDFVFAEVDLSGERGGAHVVGVEGFGDGDEADAGGSRPARSAARAMRSRTSASRSAARSAATSALAFAVAARPEPLPSRRWDRRARASDTC